MPTLIFPPFEPVQIFDRLWLGTIWNAKNLFLHNPGIGMVVNCTSETIPRVPSVHMTQLGLKDRTAIPQAKLGYAIRLLHEYFQQSSDRGVLVCCHSGISLSPAIVLAYLVGSGFGFAEAEGLLNVLHSPREIHPELMHSLHTYFGTSSLTEQYGLQGVTQ